MTEHEFDEWMRDRDPARSASIPNPDDERGRAIRDAAIRRPGSRRGLVAAIAAAVVLISAAAVGAVVWFNDEPGRIDVVCFAEADLDADRVQGDLQLGTGVDACTRPWQDGNFGGEVEGDVVGVPPLTACVLQNGAVGVFPGGTETCLELDLPVSNRGDTVVNPVRELDQRIRAAITGDGRCVPPEEAVELVDGFLAELDLADAGWAVRQTAPTSGERPCASYSVDEPALLVAIVPIPDA